MTSELLAGLEFAQQYNLTHKEIVVLIPLIRTTSLTLVELGKQVPTINTKTLYHHLQTLILKKVIDSEAKDNTGTKSYSFSP